MSDEKARSLTPNERLRARGLLAVSVEEKSLGALLRELERRWTPPIRSKARTALVFDDGRWWFEAAADVMPRCGLGPYWCPIDAVLAAALEYIRDPRARLKDALSALELADLPEENRDLWSKLFQAACDASFEKDGFPAWVEEAVQDALRQDRAVCHPEARHRVLLDALMGILKKAKEEQ